MTATEEQAVMCIQFIPPPQPNPHYLVEVPKSHPLHSGRLPLWKRRNKLHCRRLLLQHPQGKGTQNGVALINKGLASGASVDSYHFTSWREGEGKKG